ncbi:MAG: helix-turn-helix transcriptional regulator [Gemmatimonadota bacterium]
MNVDAFLPLTTPVYAVLLTLGTGCMHGYGIIQAFEERTGQKDVLLPGSLYNTIARMLRQGLLEEAPTPEAEADPRRRYYRATELGRQVVAAESARLRTLLSLAQGAGPSTA